MKKAIQLKVTFTGAPGAPPPTSAVVRDVLASGRWRHPSLSVAVKQIADQPNAGQVQARLWIEGEDAPADDFAKRATLAVRHIVGAGRWRHPGAGLTIADIAEDEDEE